MSHRTPQAQNATPASVPAPKKKRVAVVPKAEEELQARYESAEGQEKKALGRELRAMRFLRLAKKRIKTIKSQMNGLGKLASSQYVYTDAQVKNMIEILQTALDNNMNRFLASSEGEGEEEISL